MKVLLINSNQSKSPIPLVPIGLCYIASTLEENNHEVKLLDLCFSKNTEKDIKKTIENFNPGIIGITIRNIDNASGFKTDFLIEKVKNNVTVYCKKYFSGPIVIGGAAVGINPEEILDYTELEYAIYGDGEYAFLDFVNAIEKNKSIKKLKGLIWRKNGKTMVKNEQYMLKNLDKIPFARPYKYLDLTMYKLYNTTLQIQTKRGCALKCSYCSYNSIEGHNYRYRSPELIANELEDMVKNSKIKCFEIVDSIFNIPLDHAKKVLKAIIKKKIKFNSFSMVINPKFVDEEFADLLKEAGTTDVGIGAESANDKVLKLMGKNFNKKDIIKAAEIFKKKKINSKLWFLILGAEGESYETIQDTFKTINSLSSVSDAVFLGVGLRVYNGSPISKRVKKSYQSDAENNFFKPCGYKPDEISLKAIKILSTIAFFKYHNFFMYDINVALPMFFRLFLKIVFPKFPLWKIMILTKFLTKILGINFIMTKILESAFNKEIANFKTTNKLT
jgi:radical SAM superfamily enzyme YgiQ (UPF0313 family)